MAVSDRIVVDPEILAGKPIIRGTRLSIEFILELLAAGQTEAEIIDQYPGVTHEDILACFSYASYLAREYRAYPVPAQMRLIADENFPRDLVDALRRSGHDVLWVRTDCAGAKDKAVLDLAESEARILLSLDRDFWHIAMQRPEPLVRSGVVLFRVHPATLARLAPPLRDFVRADVCWAGHISVIRPGSIETIPCRKRD